MRLAPLLVAIVALLAGCAGPTASDEAHAPDATSPPASPYAGEEAREVKALSEDEVKGYREGAGLGYAKSAELNHYPGPLHALQLADALGLTPEQRADIQRVREEMLAEAVPLGEAYLAAEADIEDAFRGASVDAETLRGLIERAHAVEAQLRFVHLDAHLTTRALMTMEQVHEYDRLRGYGASDNGAHDGEAASHPGH